MAERHQEITAVGGRVAGISVDSPGQNAAMAAKLRLPFPLLSDPGGQQAIRPYEAWHDGNPFARPAVVIVAPGGQVAFREVGEDFADRLGEDQIIAALARLGLPAVTQDPPAPGLPAPGPRAVDVAWLPAYLRGGRFAVQALSGRVPEAGQEAEAMTKVYDRLLAALAAHFRRQLPFSGADRGHRAGPGWLVSCHCSPAARPTSRRAPAIASTMLVRL